MYDIFYIYLHLVDFYGFHVGKYTRPMDPLGIYQLLTTAAASPLRCLQESLWQPETPRHLHQRLRVAPQRLRKAETWMKSWYIKIHLRVECRYVYISYIYIHNYIYRY